MSHNRVFAAAQASHHSAMERPAKLQKLSDLRGRLPFISQAALATLLQIASTEELPSATRRDVREARDAIGKKTTPYGTLHQTIELDAVEGDAITLEIQHPCAMLHHVCSISESMSAMVARARRPTLLEPWRLVLYADEILPGNQLAYTSGRKLWGFYWSVLEWGSAALADEDHIYI